MNQIIAHEKAIAIMVFAALVIAGLLYWYVRPRGSAPQGPPGSAVQSVAPQAGGLGSDVYKKAANPISDKLPDTVAPVPNPIQGAYKNPFE